VAASEREDAKQKDATFVPVRVSLVAAPIEIMHRHGHVIRVHDAASPRQVPWALDGDAETAEV
jgi:hypothetical protein